MNHINCLNQIETLISEKIELFYNEAIIKINNFFVVKVALLNIK